MRFHELGGQTMEKKVETNLTFRVERLGLRGLAFRILGAVVWVV